MLVPSAFHPHSHGKGRAAEDGAGNHSCHFRQPGSFTSHSLTYEGIIRPAKKLKRRKQKPREPTLLVEEVTKWTPGSSESDAGLFWPRRLEPFRSLPQGL